MPAVPERDSLVTQWRGVIFSCSPPLPHLSVAHQALPIRLDFCNSGLAVPRRARKKGCQWESESKCLFLQAHLPPALGMLWLWL